jgi:hypothetical protein
LAFKPSIVFTAHFEASDANASASAMHPVRSDSDNGVVKFDEEHTAKKDDAPLTFAGLGFKLVTFRCLLWSWYSPKLYLCSLNFHADAIDCRVFPLSLITALP